MRNHAIRATRATNQPNESTSQPCRRITCGVHCHQRKWHFTAHHSKSCSPPHHVDQSTDRPSVRYSAVSVFSLYLASVAAPFAHQHEHEPTSYAIQSQSLHIDKRRFCNPCLVAAPFCRCCGSVLGSTRRFFGALVHCGRLRYFSKSFSASDHYFFGGAVGGWSRAGHFLGAPVHNRAHTIGCVYCFLSSHPANKPHGMLLLH